MRPAVRLAALAVPLVPLVLLAGCNGTSTPNHRGGIGYTVRWSGHSVALGSPAGKLPQGGEPIALRVGDHATLVRANAATEQLQDAFWLSTTRPGVVTIADNVRTAVGPGETQVVLATRDGRPLVFCRADRHPACPLLDVTVH